MRRPILTILMLCVAAQVAAQSHEAPKPDAKPAAADAHAPAAKPGAKPAADGAEHAAPAAPAAAKAGASRPAPVVSSITAAPKPAAHADAGDAAAVTHAPATAPGRTKKPLVSGAKGAGHEEEPAGPRVSGSPVLKTAAAPAHADPAHAPAAAPAHGNSAPASGHGAPAAPAQAGVDGKAPVKLSAVQGRIAAALAGLRADTVAAKGGDAGHGEAKAGAAKGAAPAPVKPRFVVAWPTVRWHVAWRDDLDRLTVAWPESGPRPR